MLAVAAIASAIFKSIRDVPADGTPKLNILRRVLDLGETRT
jgi:hypothetical protein